MTEEPDADPKWLRRVQLGLRDWYDLGHRELPWREDRDPYRILISETMLVQTTASAVIPYFERFLSRFPTIEALADADPTEVLKAWEGLGYYRRARQLHDLAKRIVNDHKGLVPNDLKSLQALPGIGRYIAGAILSFAFDQPAPILEANTQRVLTRLLAWPEEISKSISQKRLWQAAERLVPTKEPGLFNQAFMELGATVCTPRNPLCLICPIAAECQARSLGIQDKLPKKSPKKPPLEVVENCAIVVRDSSLLVVRRESGRLWEGFWELPTIHISGADPAARSFGSAVDLIEGVHRLTGIEVQLESGSHVIKFGVTKHRVTLHGTQASYLGGKLIPYTGFSEARFATPKEIAGYVIGSAMRKMVNWASSYIEEE